MVDQTNKKDAGKPPMELVDPYAIQQLARVLEFGANKYAPNQWRGGIEWTRVTAAVLRHTFAFLDGETFDQETGLHHMAHVMCEAMFLVNFVQTHRDMDDRYQLVEDLPWDAEAKENEKFFAPIDFPWHEVDSMTQETHGKATKSCGC